MPQYAIIEASGGQLKVAADTVIDIDLVDGGESQPGKAITFDKVLLLSGEGATRIGKPYVAGASVSAEVVTPVVMGDKIYIYKNAEKKTYRRKTGHRQRYTRVKITGIKG